MSERLVLVLVAGEAALLILALILLAGHALVHRVRERRARPLLERARAAVADALGSGEPSTSALHQLRVMPIVLQMQLVAELGACLQGADRLWLATLARALGLSDVAERACRSPRWWRRLEGARLLTILGGSDSVLRRLATDRVPLVRAQTAEWIAEHGRTDLAPLLFDMLGDEAPVCRFSAKCALSRLGGAVAEPLSAFLADADDAMLEPALEIAAALATPAFLQPALRLTRHESPRVRARCAVLLGGLGGALSVERLRAMLDDPAPDVRAAAARALGHSGHWPAAADLARLLRDSCWDVRRNAAVALNELDAPGAIMLRRALSDQDRFAADMARHVLGLVPPPAKPTVETR